MNQKPSIKRLYRYRHIQKTFGVQLSQRYFRTIIKICVKVTVSNFYEKFLLCPKLGSYFLSLFIMFQEIIPEYRNYCVAKKECFEFLRKIRTTLKMRG